MSTRLIVRVANNKSSLSRAQFLLKKVLARERRLVQAGFKSARNLGVPAQVEKTAGRIPAGSGDRDPRKTDSGNVCFHS